MLRTTLVRAFLAAALLTGAAACSDEPGPAERAPTAAAPAVACRQSIAEPTSGLLTVEQIWPSTPSTVHGYAAASYDPAGCGTPATQPVDCTQPFPWFSATAEESDAIFGSTGVGYAYTATVRGADPKPAGQVITPLEVRELVLTLHGNAAGHPVVAAAKQCAKPVQGLAFTAYRTQIDSTDIDTPITAMLAVLDDKLIWVEYDEQGWSEAAYTRVLKLAVADAHSIG
ncbi:hypothetical protein [Actinoplanes sp. TFC3]|uniref:hypothetical protein n=1 Tax=Actinoplanes sp. TFC3 TaxID=1710355 RepID=UPI0008318ACE|nr:hypothetical protein [Actinoplanes sp. TFC3]